MLGHILLGLAMLTGYAAFALLRPTRPCRRCGGHGSRRRSACIRCKGTGKVFRPGARLVHRGAAEGLAQWREWRERER